MKQLVIYIHGKGGSVKEAEHYKPFFAMSALGKEQVDKAFFISPIVNMEKLILYMMGSARVTEYELYRKKYIRTEFGETLSWEYLCYVREHPIEWQVPTYILYGGKDNLTSMETISQFAKCIGARRMDKMEDLKKDRVIPIFWDLTNEESMIKCVESIIRESGHIDVLINNAGYGSYGAIEDVPMEEVKRQFDVNLFGMARLIQFVTPGMRANNYGKIVNISSMVVKYGQNLRAGIMQQSLLFVHFLLDWEISYSI